MHITDGIQDLINPDTYDAMRLVCTNSPCLQCSRVTKHGSLSDFMLHACIIIVFIITEIELSH